MVKRNERLTLAINTMVNKSIMAAVKKKAKESGLTRSQYIRGLIVKDLAVQP